ncbi:uncharacterized protein LOC120779737 [Bactrocera tryoni]|uniref:uncharacterized protein LOC120779737 n=1 Tax=Bactrocera tryoni TaxID=59916 RepID=UPI001A97383E|nr:uncharacterized protein LOC120779737 [Bactrocera tryoni]
MAQSFYGLFIEDTQLTVGWKIVCAKVRNMRTNYNKAKELELSTGAGSMEGDTIKNTLRKMCFFYEELDDIFGSRLNCSAVVEDSLLTLLESDSTSQSGAECVVEVGSSVEAEEVQSPALNDNVCTRRQKGIYSKTALSDIL